MEILEQGRHIIGVRQEFLDWRDKIEFEVQEVRKSCDDKEVSDRFSVRSFEQHERFVARVKMNIQQNLHIVPLGEFRKLGIGFLRESPNSLVSHRTVVRRVTPYYSVSGHKTNHLLTIGRGLLKQLLLRVCDCSIAVPLIKLDSQRKKIAPSHLFPLLIYSLQDYRPIELPRLTFH